MQKKETLHGNSPAASGETAGKLTGVRAVILDMDGLMFDSERLDMEGCMEAGRRLGVPVTMEQILPTVGRNAEEVRKYLSALFGSSIQLDKTEPLYNDYVTNYVLTQGSPVKPGLMELLAHIRERGLKVAIASGSVRKRIEFFLVHGGLRPEAFGAIVSSEDTRLGKPAPDPFLRAAELLGAEPRECLVFEDSPAGAAAARAAGMRVILVPDLVPPDEAARSYAWAVLPSLLDAVQLF